MQTRCSTAMPVDNQSLFYKKKYKILWLYLGAHNDTFGLPSLIRGGRGDPMQRAEQSSLAQIRTGHAPEKQKRAYE